MEVSKLSEKRTPYYLYDLELLEKTLQCIRLEAGKHANFHVHYAIKANANPLILNVVRKYGFGISHFTKKLLKNHLVHFVATDAHDTERRAPELLECRELISRKFGQDYSDRLLWHNPMSVINNETI